jgi:WD40 repeat protein
VHADRVVPVIRFARGQRRVGSGYRVAAAFVLTAAHCLRGSGHRVWLPDGEHAAQVVALGSPGGVDLALLKIIPTSDQALIGEIPPVRCARVDRSTPGRIGGCVAVGYPRFAGRPEAPLITCQVDGWIPIGSGLIDTATGRRSGFLTLRAEGPMPLALPTSEENLTGSVWAGMSGAAVFVDDLLVGVVAEHHLPEGDGSLTVVPIEWAERLHGAEGRLLLQVLGVESAAGMEPLTAGTQRRRWASVLPEPPSALVERPAVLAMLRQALLTAKGRPVLAAGMGGAGKSVLAAQLARAIQEGRDPELTAAYPAGVAWVSVGRDRPLGEVQVELARAFGEDQPGPGGDWQSARARLQQLAAGRCGLLVLDDVWALDRYEPFRLGTPGIQVLITTRNQELDCELGGISVMVGELERDQSRQLLASASGMLPAELPAEADRLLSEVGHLALGVAMMGGMAGKHGALAWPAMLHRLRERRLDRIAHRFADNYQHATLLRAIEFAVDDLDSGDRERWAELAVFAGQPSIPVQAMSVLWQPFDDDELDTGDRIRRFLARSLLQHVGHGRYRLHDLQDDAALLRLGSGLASAHARLADAYARRVANAIGIHGQARWAKLAAALARRSAVDPAWQAADDGYLLSHLISHLRSGGRQQEAARLLGNYNWISLGLARRGLADLACDYGGLPAEDPLRLVGDGLTRSRQALTTDPGCLPDQILGRFADAKDPALAPLLARVRAEQARRRLQIIRSGLKQPSGSLVHVLTGPYGWVEAVAITNDGTRAVIGTLEGPVDVWNLRTGERLQMLRGHRRAVSKVVVSNDDTRLITGSNVDETAIVWELNAGKQLHTLTGRNVAVNADGTRAVTAGENATTIVWDLNTGKPLHTLSRDDNYDTWVVSLNGDGSQAITTSSGPDKGPIVRDLSTGERLHTLTGRGVAVDGDWSKAVTSSDKGTLTVWDLSSGKRLRTLAASNDRVWKVAISGDGNRAVSSSGDGSAVVWDLESGKRLRTLTGHHDWIEAMAVTADGNRIVTGSQDGTAMAWDLATGAPPLVLTGHRSAIKAVALTGDGTKAVTGSYDGTAMVWDLTTSMVRRNPVGHYGKVSAVAVTANGKCAITASHDGTAIVWDPSTGAALRTLTGHEHWVTAVVVTSNGTTAVTSGDDGKVIIWDLATGSPLRTLVGHQGEVFNVAVTVEDCVIATGGDEVIVWDLRTGARLQTLTGGQRELLALAVTADGGRAVTGGIDNTAIVWDLRTGARVHTLTGHEEGVWSVAVSPEGSHAITGGEDGMVFIWDLATGERVHTLTEHGGMVDALAVTGDGSRAIVASRDGTTIVWDLATGTPLHHLVGHHGPVMALALTADDAKAVTAGLDGTAIIWNLDTARPIARWHGDAGMVATACVPKSPIFIAGDLQGGVSIMRLRTHGPKN